jgi:peptidylprolyl isomerase
MGVIFAAGMILGLMGGIFTSGGTSSGDVPHQANELEDAPQSGETPSAAAEATPTPLAAKRYTSAPALAIDVTKKYLATIKTGKGDIQIELYPDQAPEAVNAFVFLANDGYYDKTPFMRVSTYADGSRLTAQAGDPTRTGFGTPGFSVKKESTSRPFVRGAVGMGGSSSNSNGGQFFISYVSDPALNGKYTIFGQVVSGLDILDSLTLLDLTDRGGSAAGDEILSVTITAQ